MGCSSSKPEEPPKTTTPKKVEPSTSQRPPPIEEDPPPEVTYKPFTEFPSPPRLSEAHTQYAELQNESTEDDGREEGRPQPPLTKKRDLECEKWHEIDQHAIKTPTSLGSDPTSDLLSHLFTPTNDDVAKLRALYTWVISQDLVTYDLSEMPAKNSAFYLLLRARANKGSYTDVLLELCRRANLTAKKVRGQFKGPCTVPGQDIAEGATWCAVLLNGSWRLVDPNIGRCRCGSDSEDSSSLLLKTPRQGVKGVGGGGGGGGGGVSHRHHRHLLSTLNEHYFLTDPEVFIYDHYAEDHDWQLLPRPVTKEEFRDMTLLRQGFFELGFRDLSHPQGVIRAEEGEALLELTYKEEMMLEFRTELRKSSTGGGGGTSSRGVKALSNCVLMYANADNRKVFFIRPPTIGRYLLNIYAQDMVGKDRSWHMVCQYAIDCEKPKFDARPTPQLPKEGLGYSPDMAMHNMRCIHNEGVLTAQNGEIDISLQCDQNDLEFQHTLRCRGMRMDDLAKYVRHYWVENAVTFLVKFPARGRYLFQVYYKRARSAEDFTSLCSYLIESDVACLDTTPLPAASNGKLGCLSTKSDPFIFAPVSHKEPVFEAVEQVQVVMTCTCSTGSSTKVDVQARLEYVTEKGGVENMTSYLWTQEGVGRWVFLARFPKAGTYDLSLFTRGGKQSLLKNVWKYAILVDTPQPNCVPFPEQGKGWKPSFNLIEPQSLYLPENQSAHFELHIPGGEEVVVSDLGVGKYMKLREGDEEHNFFGLIDAPEGGLEVGMQVSALFPTYSTYIPLLLYQVQGEWEKQALAKQQNRYKQDARMRINHMDARKREVREDADLQKQLEDEKVQQMEEEFQSKKETLVEKEKEEQRDEDDIRRKRREKEEECWRESERSLTDAQVEEILEQELVKLREEADSEIMKRRRMQAGLKANLLRERIREGTRLKDRSLLKTAIPDFESARLQEENGDLTAAKRTLAILDAQHNLRKAMKARDIDDICDSIDHIVDNGYYGSHTLQAEVHEADSLLRDLQRLAKLTDTLLSMDARTKSEIRSYQRPPVVVHKVIVAALLMLSVHEDKTRDWRACQRRLTDLDRRLRKFRAQEIHPDICARVSELLSAVDFEEVRKVSAGATAFYYWARASVEEALEFQGEEAEDVTPADVERQKEIFRNQPYSVDMMSTRTDGNQTAMTGRESADDIVSNAI